MITAKEPWDDEEKSGSGDDSIMDLIVPLVDPKQAKLTQANRDVRELLAAYDALMRNIDLEEQRFQAKVSKIKSPVQAQIDSLQHSIDELTAPYLKEIEAARAESLDSTNQMKTLADRTKAKIEAYAADVIESVHGGVGWYAEWHKPTSAFDKDLLVGFSKAVPAVMQCATAVPAKIILKRERKGN